MTRAADQVVTPDAVVVDVAPAGLATRVAAILIDLLLMGMAWFVVFFLAGLAVGVAAPGSSGVSPTVVVIAVLSLTFAVLFGYPVASETLWRGRTIGKAALGLRVVTTDGAPVRFRHAAIRAALSLVDFYATSGAAAVLTALMSRRTQRLGDLAAGTVVVRERTGAPRTQPVWFAPPPGWEDFATSLDVGALDARDYATVRQFLLRAPSLRVDARRRLAGDLASGLAVRLHRSLQGVDPEGFLWCVAARLQQRGVAPATRRSQVAAAPTPQQASGQPAAPSPAAPPRGPFAPPQ